MRKEITTMRKEVTTKRKASTTNMRKAIITLLVCLLAHTAATACTNLIVGKHASTDGSVMCTYACDSYGLYFGIPLYPAADHQPGTMRQVANYYSRIPHGQIPEASHTYHAIGNINEWQVAIGESTYNVGKELQDSTATMDYPTMMGVALQRARTAREAIQIMGDLADRYGYVGQGESFSVCDANEAWIMETISCGPGTRKAVWAAVRIPDNAISGHANQSRITHIIGKGYRRAKVNEKPRPYDNPTVLDVMYSKDVITFARQSGRFSGKDEEFSFREAYNPLAFSGRRMCEARVWTFFNRFCKDAIRYFDYVEGKRDDAEPMPLYMVPDRKLSLADVQATMRDHYEGTPFAPDRDLTQGQWASPYRPPTATFRVDGNNYFNERLLSTPQSAFSWVCQMRSWLPREVGGIMWFGNDEANMTAQTPVFCSISRVPDPYVMDGRADDVTFSMQSAFWVCNWVANMVYPRYSQLFPELKQVRDSLDNHYAAILPQIDAEASRLLATNRNEGIAYLTEVSDQTARQMLSRWQQMAWHMIVKYNDQVVKPEKDGQFLRTPYGRGQKVERTGYTPEVQRQIVEATGDRYLRPKAKKKQ